MSALKPRLEFFTRSRTVASGTPSAFSLLERVKLDGQTSLKGLHCHFSLLFKCKKEGAIIGLI